VIYREDNTEGYSAAALAELNRRWAERFAAILRCIDEGVAELPESLYPPGGDGDRGSTWTAAENPPADHSAFVRELTALCRAHGVTLDLRAGDGCPPEVASAVRDADVEIVLRPIDPGELGEWTETNSGAVYWPIRE
jgi:hypothetical protein